MQKTWEIHDEKTRLSDSSWIGNWKPNPWMSHNVHIHLSSSSFSAQITATILFISFRYGIIHNFLISQFNFEYLTKMEKSISSSCVCLAKMFFNDQWILVFFLCMALVFFVLRLCASIVVVVNVACCHRLSYNHRLNRFATVRSVKRR